MIGVAQDDVTNVRRQLAARNIYRKAKRVHFWGSSVALLLALASPFVLLFDSELGPKLAAVAAFWIFVTRLIVEPLKRRYQGEGALAQERFDVSVLGLTWNDSLGDPLSEEEISSYSADTKHRDGVLGWYPIQEERSWPSSVLTCQRANAVWSRRQHYSYAWLLGMSAASWALFGVAISLIDGATLGRYLVVVALPSLPALLDAAELSRGHFESASKRQRVENQTDEHLKDPDRSWAPVREIQDQLFLLRSETPMVPEWFYNRIKVKYEQDMLYAADNGR